MAACRLAATGLLMASAMRATSSPGRIAKQVSMAFLAPGISSAGGGPNFIQVVYRELGGFCRGAVGMCLSSIILSPLNGNVKLSPYEQGDLCIQPERAA